MANSMKARFASNCPSCGETMKVGKEIVKNSDEKWVHKHCAEDSLDLP